MYHEKEILKYLKSKYPDDDAIKHLTLKEIRSVIRIYCNNIERRLLNGFLVTIGKYLSLYYFKKKHYFKIKTPEDDI